MRYDVRVSELRYGEIEVDADSAEEAKERAEYAAKNGKLVYFDSEITDIIAEPLGGDRTYVVTEYCPNCEREVEIHGWDTERDGYQAFCPYCGGVLMLCDECQHTEPRQPCDFNTDTGLCRYGLVPDRQKTEGATCDVR